MDLRNIDQESADPITRPFLTVSASSNGSALIEATGELDLATTGTVRDILDSIDPETGVVELDLSRVTFMDCAGYASIAAAAGGYRAAGRSITIVSASPQVIRLLQLIQSDGEIVTLPYTIGSDDA
jgi:anti-anti-sigma factor